MSLDTVLLRDEFSDTVAPGAVNGTLATDGVNIRAVVDTGNYLSVSSGNLSVAGGTATQGDPAISWNQKTRTAGMAFLYAMSVASGSTSVYWGADGGVNGVNTGNGFNFGNGSLSTRNNNVAEATIALLSFSTQYRYFVVTRTAGAFFFVMGGAFTYPTLLWISSVYSGNPYPRLSFRSTVNSVDFVRVAGYWLPAPLVSDGFSTNGTSDGLGHAETSGIGSGGSGISWSNVGGGWSVSGGKAINTPSTGGELLADGDMELAGVANWTDVGTPTTKAKSSIVHGGTQSLHIISNANFNGAQTTFSAVAGKWYRVSGWLYAASGDAQILCSIAGGTVNKVQSSATWAHFLAVIRETSTLTRQITCRCQTTLPSDQYYDDISVKELALSSLLSLHASSTPDVFVGIDLTVTAGTQAGLALNWDSSSNPQNGVLVHFDGTTAKLEKCVAGVWTTVGSAAATGARLVVSKIGTAYRFYQNNTLIGAVTVADVGIINNTLHGRFSTDPSNTLDNYAIYASGTGGEYDSALQIVLSNERTATMSMADSLLKVPAKILSDVLSLSDSLLRTVIKTELVQMALNSVAVKVPVKMLSDVLSLSDSVLRTIIKSEAVQMAIDSTATKTAIKSFIDGIAFARAQAINYGRKIIRIIRLKGKRGGD